MYCGATLIFGLIWGIILFNICVCVCKCILSKWCLLRYRLKGLQSLTAVLKFTFKSHIKNHWNCDTKTDSQTLVDGTDNRFPYISIFPCKILLIYDNEHVKLVKWNLRQSKLLHLHMLHEVEFYVSVISQVKQYECEIILLGVCNEQNWWQGHISHTSFRWAYVTAISSCLELNT